MLEKIRSWPRWLWWGILFAVPPLIVTIRLYIAGGPEEIQNLIEFGFVASIYFLECVFDIPLHAPGLMFVPTIVGFLLGSLLAIFVTRVGEKQPGLAFLAYALTFAFYILSAFFVFLRLMGVPC